MIFDPARRLIVTLLLRLNVAGAAWAGTAVIAMTRAASVPVIRCRLIDEVLGYSGTSRTAV
jgi:hypothetical protein